MVAFVVGHGLIESKGDETVVPIGCSITFLVNADRKLFMGNALAALEANSSQYGIEYSGGSPVDNYMFFTLTDEERVFFETVRGNTGSPLAKAWFIGDDDDLNWGIALCEPPTEPEGTACQGGTHSCTGILGLLQRGKFQSKAVVMLACRELAGAGLGSQEEYGNLDPGERVGEEGEDPAATAYSRADEARLVVALPSRLERADYVVQLGNEMTPESQSRLAYLRSNTDLGAALQYYWDVVPPLWERINRLGAQDPVDMDELGEVYDEVAVMDAADQSWLRRYPQINTLLTKWELDLQTQPLAQDLSCEHCQHLVSAHNPVSGCKENGCMCGFGTSWFDPSVSLGTDDESDGTEAESEAAVGASGLGDEQQPSCVTCSHPRSAHLAGLCVGDGCDCTNDPESAELFA